MLADIVQKGKFPDDSFLNIHIDKISEFEKVGNKYQFSIERHPYLFGSATRGKASSAFIPEEQIFELDPKKKEVVLIYCKQGKPVIDIEMLVSEDVENCLEWWPDNKTGKKLAKLKTERKVISSAEREFKSINWWIYDDALAEINDPSFKTEFKAKYMELSKKYFITNVVKKWQYMDLDDYSD